ncbi:MatE family protein [Tritrichomonas foetus]|uniref:MatE family protein n=1 Tax=Tritrichomonas foetus TaxID=1144522 RepID=A0A1J4JAK7_9EUKA|nr:MatE family protein [Tritrichomonas foetus]|eukprot:OHS95705.1 MatE family protein [Tritrichomonas foetus]
MKYPNPHHSIFKYSISQKHKKMSELEEPLNKTPLDEEELDQEQPNEIKSTPPAKPGAKNAEERYRLGGRPPLITLAILLVGPFVSQVVNGLYGVISSMWVARALGDIGMAAISLYSNLDMIGRAVGFFMLTAASQRISSLFGENKGDEAGQVICDLFRCCFIGGMIVPAILIPCSRPLAAWFGAEKLTTDMAFNYLTPLNACSCITCVYLMWCGCLQAMGRSLLVGAVQIASLVANMAIFCPLFLLVFKWGTVGAAFATIVSEFIPAFTLTILFFCGKFGVKPDWRGLFRKFSPHTTTALKIGLSQLIMNLSRSIPSIFNRKFMGLCAENRGDTGDDGTFEDAIAGFNAVSRIYAVTDAVRLAVSMGLLPSASFAFTSHRYKRIFTLIFHAVWIDLVWSIATTLLTAFGSRYVAMSISTSENYLRWAAPMLRTANWEAPIAWIRNIIQTTLQALQYGMTSTIYSFFSTFCTYIGGLLILYYTNKYDFVRLMYVFVISSGIAAFVGFFVVFPPLYKIWKERHEDNDEVIPNPKDTKNKAEITPESGEDGIELKDIQLPKSSTEQFVDNIDNNKEEELENK